MLWMDEEDVEEYMKERVIEEEKETEIDGRTTRRQIDKD